MPMERYAKRKKYKLEDSRPDGVPVTSKFANKAMKEEIRNANRSFKKSVRQSAKKELRKYIDR